VPKVMTAANERLNTSPAALPKRLKDLECDVFAWRPFSKDLRRGHDVLLAQCAIGNEWDIKHVNLDRWRAIATFAVPPRKGASFPFVPRVMRPGELTPDEVEAEEIDLGAAVGLWLDRLRLARLLGNLTSVKLACMTKFSRVCGCGLVWSSALLRECQCLRSAKTLA
jgi:hypothetical protein